MIGRGRDERTRDVAIGSAVARISLAVGVRRLPRFRRVVPVRLRPRMEAARGTKAGDREQHDRDGASDPRHGKFLSWSGKRAGRLTEWRSRSARNSAPAAAAPAFRLKSRPVPLAPRPLARMRSGPSFRRQTAVHSRWDRQARPVAPGPVWAPGSLE
jgi:hypothetical protein